MVVWDIVNGTEVLPEPTTTTTSTSKAGNCTDDDPVEAWSNKDKKAFVEILSSLCNSQLMYVRSGTTSAAAWRKLQNVHKPPKSLTRMLHLRREFLTTVFREGAETVHEYIGKITD